MTDENRCPYCKRRPHPVEECHHVVAIEYHPNGAVKRVELGMQRNGRVLKRRDSKLDKPAAVEVTPPAAPTLETITRVSPLLKLARRRP